MLEHLTERVAVAPGGVNIGVILGNDDAAILIDTGLNDTAVRKVLRRLAEIERRVTAIVTTHGHADHFGGNAFVVKRTGATVYAPSRDEAVLRYPLLQPALLFAGADPPTSMRGSFMLAEASPVDVVYDEGAVTIDGVDLQVINLAGHSMNQQGILVDGVFFCADVVLPERVIERYRIPYLFSVTDHLVALDRAELVMHTVAVPGHGPTVDSISPLVAMNREIVLRVADIILDEADAPTTPEALLAAVLVRLGGNPSDAPSYYLLHPTIFAFLSYLERAGQVRHEVLGGRSLWQRT